MLIQFTVPGRPPRQDGANAMFGEIANQFESLQRLRTEAANVANGFLFDQNVTLGITIIFQCNNNAYDIDNGINGIFDGLQAAHPNMRQFDPQWKNVDDSIAPEKSIIIQDDKQFIEVSAKRIDGDHDSYTVSIYNLP